MDVFPDICMGCLYRLIADIGGFMFFWFVVFIVFIVLWEFLKPKK